MKEPTNRERLEDIASTVWAVSLAASATVAMSGLLAVLVVDFGVAVTKQQCRRFLGRK